MRAFLGFAFLLVLSSVASASPLVVVDDFEDVSGWSANPAAGVELRIGSDAGVHGGKALRLDFDFVRGGGYAVAHKTFNVTLPANYRFHFAVRGATTPEDLEFKLIDSTGANVWWMNRRNFTFPTEWDSLTTKKRQIEFAWGPIGGGEIRHVAAIEIAITAGSGGKGSVWLDDLTLEELPPPGGPLPKPVVVASSSLPGSGPARAFDGDSLSAWRNGPSDSLPALTIDFGVDREFSAVLLDWVPGFTPPAYVLERSDDGQRWTRIHEVLQGRRGRNWIHAPDSEARFLRIRATRGVRAPGVALAEVRVEAPDWAPTANSFFRHVAGSARRGIYPRGIAGEQPYWTVIGVDRDAVEALVDEDGRIEPWKGGPSIEPFLYMDGKLITWADVQSSQSLVESDLPIPIVRWTVRGLELEVTALTVKDPTIGTRLHARYRVRNLGKTRRVGTLSLAMRPFQVNPPTQFLNTTGGVAPVAKLSLGRVGIVLGGHGPVLVQPPADQFGAASRDEGDVVQDWLVYGHYPGSAPAAETGQHSSGALGFAFDLAPGGSKDIELTIWRLDGIPRATSDRGSTTIATVNGPSFNDALAQATAEWRARRGEVVLEVPPSGRDAIETLRAQLAYALVTRDSVALMPGARSYERSWIRDGALSANAFLRMGQPDVAKDFAEWFARFVPEDGAVPCCVDQRGADPTPEHDSHGEFVYLIAEVLRYTGDLAFAETLWPAARRAAAHIDTLRAQRRTAEWRTPENAPYFGLLPPSISHEGYSAKPMHSYWDDFFALRGLTDAEYLARRLGHADDAKRFAASRDTFAYDLAASIRAAQKVHGIDYVPGCADLGDFDATSTTIAFDPVDAEAIAGPEALENTFERYWKYFVERRDGPHTWDAYTPYEVRTIGALARLGQRDRANQALKYFLKDRRPPGFRDWAEVVGREYRKPRFIGDMPHTWVGTDYVRSVIDLFAYARGADSALVVGAGLPREWVADTPGVHVAKLPTPFGPLAFRMRAEGARTVCELEDGMRVPPGGFVLAPPARKDKPWRKASVDGRAATLDADGRLTVRTVPALVVFE